MTNQRSSNYLLVTLLLMFLAYISINLSAEATLDERRRLLVYAVMFACGVFATALPSALIPDPTLSTQQLFNTSPSELLTNQVKRWKAWIASVCLPVLLIALVDLSGPGTALLNKGIWVISHVLTITAMGVYSLCVYFSIGPVSQKWQEGSKGRWWNNVLEVNPVLPPSGLVPAMSSTARVFGVGVLITMASMILERDVHAYLTPIPGLLMLIWSLRKLRVLRKDFDRFYYHTNAFYSEFLRTGSFTSQVKETTPYGGLYWVPSRWRPHTWASLVQLERALPIGRFVVVAIVFLWILSWRNASPATLTAYLALLIVGKNLSVLVFSRPILAAPLLTRVMQSTFHWGMTRGFVNLKWSLSLAVGFLPMIWLDTALDWQTASLWVLADILCSFIFAFCITYGTAKRERNAFA